MRSPLRLMLAGALVLAVACTAATTTTSTSTSTSTPSPTTQTRGLKTLTHLIFIVQENRRYARRQLIWFRKEPNLRWFDGPGERPETLQHVEMTIPETRLQGDAI